MTTVTSGSSCQRVEYEPQALYKVVVVVSGRAQPSNPVATHHFMTVLSADTNTPIVCKAEESESGLITVPPFPRTSDIYHFSG
jgi:hypothetical protein